MLTGKFLWQINFIDWAIRVKLAEIISSLDKVWSNYPGGVILTPIWGGEPFANLSRALQASRPFKGRLTKQHAILLELVRDFLKLHNDFDEEDYVLSTELRNHPAITYDDLAALWPQIWNLLDTATGLMSSLGLGNAAVEHANDIAKRFEPVAA